MKCQIKPDFHFLPSLWNQVPFMSALGREKGELAAELEPCPCRGAQSLSVQKQWHYRGSSPGKMFEVCSHPGCPFFPNSFSFLHVQQAEASSLLLPRVCATTCGR